MDQHEKLRVLVRLDIDPQVATVQVSGCLTEASCETLLPIFKRAGSLAADAAVVVDLHDAGHVDWSALERLETSGLVSRILTPDTAGICTADAAGTSEAEPVPV